MATSSLGTLTIPIMAGNADQNKALKSADVRISSIIAAKTVANALRPSLGRIGMEEGKSRNGAAMLSKLNIQHPAGMMLVHASKLQYANAADGTSSAVIIAGALSEASGRLIAKGVPASAITASFMDSSDRAVKTLEEASRHMDDERDVLLRLGSKVAELKSDVLTRVAVDSVLELLRQDPSHSDKVDLGNIRVIRQLGSRISDTKVESGLILARKKEDTMPTSGPVEANNVRVALLEYWMSPPKSGIETLDQMSKDQQLKEERKRILNECRQMKKLGADVVLILKPDSVEGQMDVSLRICLHFLAKMDIMAIPDICRDDVEFIARSLGCNLAGHPDTITPEKLGSASCVRWEKDLVKFTGLENPTATIMLHGPSDSVLSGAERTICDVQSFVRTLKKKPFLVAGGGAAETEAALRLKQYAQSIGGIRSQCVKAFADALEIIPYTLAENAGMEPIETVKELRRKHADGMSGAGVAMKQGVVMDMYDISVMHPLLVPTSAIELATKTACMIFE